MKRVAKQLKSESGMAALMTVLIIGMAALTMATVSSLAGLDEMDMSNSSDQGHEALLAAESCAVDALRMIKLNPSSVPLAFTLPLDSGSCIISMPDSRTILATGRTGDFVRHVRADITIDGAKLSVTGWQEE